MTELSPTAQATTLLLIPLGKKLVAALKNIRRQVISVTFCHSPHPTTSPGSRCA